MGRKTGCENKDFENNIANTLMHLCGNIHRNKRTSNN